MTAVRSGLAAMVLTGIVAATGCGVGPGEAEEGTAELTVSRDYGAEVLKTATLEDPTASDTVVRFLDDNAEVETDYGGNFVSAIDGLEGSTEDGGPEDWFFFVNGIYSELGAGEVEVNAGDRIWWDHHRWSEAYRIPAVVGSFPEPFVSGYGEGPARVVVQCLTDAAACESVSAELEDAGVTPEVEELDRPGEPSGEIRVLVGPWDALRSDPAAAAIEDGPGASGVYADMNECAPGDWELEVLGADAEPRALVPAGGLVAGVRRGEDPPTFLVAATDDDPDAIAATVAAFDSDSLLNRYAVAADARPVEGADAVVPVPIADESPRVSEGCG